MCRCAFLVFVILALGCTPAVAASPWQRLAQPVFVRPDTRDLPEAAAMSLAQDSAGFIWVGTQGGLARFDGYRYRNFLPNPSDPQALPDGYVRSLLADVTGGVWIGSSSNGLVHFDPVSETFRTWRADRAGRSGPRSASIDALATSPDGQLWIGGDGGLDRFDPKANAFASVPLTGRGPQPVVWSFLIDRAGTLWAGTQAGLYYRRTGDDRFRRFAFDLPARGPASPVYSLIEDRAGDVWAGSADYVYAIDSARRHTRALHASAQRAATLSPGQQWALTEMTPGVIWAGTDAALSIIDAKTLHVQRVSPDPENAGGFTSGRLVQFLRDRSGLVWIANHVGGLLLYNPSTRGLYELSATRPDIGFREKGAVAVAATSGNDVWVGGFSGHLAEFDPQHLRKRDLTMPNHGAIQTLARGDDGTIYAGTTGGLCVLAPGAAAATCPGVPSQAARESVYALLFVDGKLWIGGSGGLFIETLATKHVEPYPPSTLKPLANNQVRVLFRDRRRRVWIGTENGLSRVDPNGTLTRFMYDAHDPNSLGPGGMASLLEDRRGRLWAGANGGPLDIIEDLPGGSVRITRIGLANGLPHENVDGLAEDGRGRIWAATDKGIAAIDPKTLRARAFGAADGVTDGAYWAGAVAQAADGTIVLGGIDGITIVEPNAGSAWNDVPPVVVSALRIGRTAVSPARVNEGSERVHLPPAGRDINVEFSALDYSAPQALHYAYRLDGYDRDWIETDAQHRVANYTNLSPGDYTLEVRGSNRLGAYGDRALKIAIVAEPAWTETWWFRVLAGVLLALAAYAVYRWRTAVLRRRQRELETIVGDRTHALSEANGKLQELSLSDPLTGLRNRRFLAQHLEADVAVSLRRYDDWRAEPFGSPPHDADLLFFLIDLDHLKIINDQYGHHAGDSVLIQMRDRLNEVFRESDFVVRWGGDEFLAVARGGKRAEATQIAERLCHAVAARPFALGGGQTIGGSVSVGFAAFPFVPSAPGAIAWPQVVTLADQALYMAKQAGRSTWFGLAAGNNTDPEVLVQTLEHNPDEAVSASNLEVLSRGMSPAR